VALIKRRIFGPAYSFCPDPLEVVARGGRIPDEITDSVGFPVISSGGTGTGGVHIPGVWNHWNRWCPSGNRTNQYKIKN